MENLQKKVAELEALLFIHGEPISYKKVESVLKIDKEECENVIAALKQRLEDDAHGLQLVVGNDKVQLATKPEFNTILESFVREELSEDLTPASLEALAIICYLGPISRARIEYLRGVNSLVILRSLLIRGLIERIPDPEHASISLYQTTFDLMKQLGIQGKDDLPEYEKFQELLKVFDEQKATNA
jgi:segregation and condensation protein B